MDEISPLGCTRVLEVRNGVVTEWSIEPAHYGLGSSADDLSGGEPAANAARVTAVLDGSDTGGARSAVLLNAAAAIYVSGETTSFADGIAAAARSIDSGSALGALTALREASVGG
jgi:anthranilate phosphoribosyltransferase